MKNFSRIIIAVGIFLVGAALIPFVGLPQDGFSWQRFADAYVPAALEINFDSGSPGSYFTVNGYNFPQNDSVSIIVNGNLIGSITTDNNGDFLLIIDSSIAETGFYILSTNLVDGPEVSFRLSLDAPLRLQEDEGPIFLLPSGISLQLTHLPFVNR